MSESNLAQILGLSSFAASGAGDNIVRLFDEVRPARVPDGIETDGSSWSVPPLAVLERLNERAELREATSGLSHESLRLSRFAYLRPIAGALVLESPLSQFRMRLTDSRAGKLLSELVEPRSIMALGRAISLSTDLVEAFMQLLWRGGFLAEDAESAEHAMWDFHNLVFHARKRWQDAAAKSEAPAGAGGPGKDQASAPVVKPAMSQVVLPLPRPGPIAPGHEPTLTSVVEARRSIRTFDEDHPITLEQLGEFLYRAARVKGVCTFQDKFGHLANSGAGDPDALLSDRPYPASGARYELELYPVVRHCSGLDGGLYHYDPLHHQLEKIKDGNDADVIALIDDAFAATARESKPQVLLVVAARFDRMFEAYPYLGYALVLKNAGALLQNFYLMATGMNLGGCAVGEITHEALASAAVLGFLDEATVGGFILGTPGNEGATSAADGEDSSPAGQPATPAAGPDPQAGAAAPASHDLDDRFPGLSALRTATLGDPQVTIVILDGDPDLTLGCFHGSTVSKKYPFWHERAEPIAPEQHARYRELMQSDLEPEALQEQLAAAFPPAVLNRIVGDRHATHVTSTIAGQPNSPAPGIAPHCRVIVVPLNEPGDHGEFMSALNLARGFELAQELGANVIHCAACVPTQTGQAQELLARAVRNCLDANVLVVAPVGNDSGACRCIPAVLPDTLGVGALKDDGRPFNFSNWGGNYSNDAIMAPGERILCAQPCTEEPTREKGTSLAAPVVSGIVALLMSRQLQHGQPIDAAAIRSALLDTARPCDPSLVDEPERCLRGVIDLPAAVERLFPDHAGVGASSNRELVLPTGATQAAGMTMRSVSGAGAAGYSVPVAAASDRAAEIMVAGASGGIVPAAAEGASVKPSTAHSGLVYALGRLSYDLGSEVGVQTLQQRMALAVERGQINGANPYEVGDLIDYLDLNPTERRCIIWTLEMEGGPIYALVPKGPYADQIYEILLQLLNGQIQPEDSAAFIERVSIPGMRTGGTQELFSRAKVPVVALADVRGIYGWHVNGLVHEAVNSVLTYEAGGPSYEVLRDAIVDFLRRVYYELRNYGVTSRDRAMNFTATNCVQAASAFAKALSERRVLRSIAVEKSQVCRMHSDCWELHLTFHDPLDSKRAETVFQFTVDVSDVMPVTVGGVRSWARRRLD